MGSLAKADQPGDVAHGDRRLLDQQLRGDVQAAREQILAEGRLAELRVGARHLARRAGKRPGDLVERQRTAVVASDDDTREQIQAAALLDRGGAHAPLSDRSTSAGPSRPSRLRIY
jgi:hypothetical protein